MLSPFITRKLKRHVQHVPTESPSSRNQDKNKNSKVTRQETHGEELVGRAFLEMADARASLGDWDAAAALWSKALALQLKQGSRTAAIAETLTRRGRHYYSSMGQTYNAVLDLERAVHIKQELLVSAPVTKKETLATDLVDSLLYLSEAQHEMQHFVGSIQSLKDALQHCASESKVAEIHCQIATSYHRRRMYKEARHSYRLAMAALRRAGTRNDHPVYTRVKRCIADRNILGHSFFQSAKVVARHMPATADC